jgi:hypothetical protein
MFTLTEDKTMLGYELMNSCPDIVCFSTTRQGGVGTGNYSSFNCTHYCGDNPDAVRRNREILLSHLPEGTRLVIPHQTHGTEVAVVDEALLGAEVADAAAVEADAVGAVADGVEAAVAVDGVDGVEAAVCTANLEGVDALVTNLRGVCLCISTADCVPVLLYDRHLKVIGAAHAGWRGTLARIVEKTLHRMTEQYGSRPQDIRACIGPSISLLAFEVGNEVYEAFRADGYDMKLISQLNPTTGKHHIDLWEINRQQLISCGVPKKNIELSGMCTYLNPEILFSARRLGVKSGRILTGIMVKD